MATKKKLLQAAAGSAGGELGLNVEQLFSTYLYEGNGSSQVIENGINLGQSNGSGSIGFKTSGNGLDLSSTITLTGDFTVEAWVWREATSYSVIIGSPTTTPNDQFGVNNSNLMYAYTSAAEHNSTSTVPSNEWVHLAFSRSGTTLYFFINGNAAGTATTSVSYSLKNIGITSFVSNSWIGYISDLRVVSGSALYTSSFTAPTAPLTAVTGTQLLTGQGDSPLVDNSSNNYTLSKINSPSASAFGPLDAANAGEGGLVWIKQRSAAYGHYLYDTERGVQKGIASDSTAVEQTGRTGVTSFNSNGFSLGNFTYENASGSDIASWTFRKAPKFFDVVTWTGDGTAGRTISHNLNSSVGTIFVKRTDGLDEWKTLHRNDGSQWKTGVLNSTTSFDNASGNLFGTGSSFVAPTSTEFTVTGNLNGNTDTFVAYLFAHNDGDGEFGPDGDADIIKCGSYTGNNGSSHHVELGFEPQWLLVKNADLGTSGAWWSVVDVMRGMADNDIKVLKANASDAEINENGFTPTATGFTVANNNDFQNNSTNTYIYIAIRRGPMAVPTDATDVFEPTAYSGNNTANRTIGSLTIDMNIVMDRNNGSNLGMNQVWDRVRGENVSLYTNTNDVEVAGWGDTFYNLDQQYGFSNGSDTSFLNNTSANYISYIWKRAPSFCDVVAYTGSGTARTVSHNLGVAPEMIWVKDRDRSVYWSVFHKDLGSSKRIKLNETAAADNSTGEWNAVDPTSTEFTVGVNTSVNFSGDDYIAYLFASVDGVSKVGSFTSDGTDLTIDCGFTSGARFILLRDTSALGAWFVWDTERGIVAGNDPSLKLNDTAAENTSNDFVDPHSSGFIVNSSFTGTGKLWIYYAIA